VSSTCDPSDPLAAGVESLGAVYLGGDRLEVLAFSKERLEYVRRIVEEILGPLLREMRTYQQDAGHLNETWKRRGEPIRVAFTTRNLPVAAYDVFGSPLAP
jgi:hypothetical protein